MKEPQELWAFWANLHGPLWKTPQLVQWDVTAYYHKNGNASIDKEGVEQRDGYIAFAHRDKSEVQRFIKGFMACRKLLGEFYVD